MSEAGTIFSSCRTLTDRHSVGNFTSPIFAFALLALAFETAQYEKLNEEIAKSLTGESFYSPEQLSAAIKSVRQKIESIKSELEKLDFEIQNKKDSMEKVKPMYEQFKGWAGEFKLATNERKKMIISQIIGRIELGKGYKIKITLNMEYEQFCESVIL